MFGRFFRPAHHALRLGHDHRGAFCIPGERAHKGRGVAKTKHMLPFKIRPVRADFTVEEAANQQPLSRAVEIMQFKDVGAHHETNLRGRTCRIKRCMAIRSSYAGR